MEGSLLWKHDRCILCAHIKAGELKHNRIRISAQSISKAASPPALPPSTRGLRSFGARTLPLHPPFFHSLSSTGEPVSRAGWTKQWEREKLLGRNVSHCRLDNRVREEGRVHGREAGAGSTKGEDNNTLLSAEIWGFLQSVSVERK